MKIEKVRIISWLGAKASNVDARRRYHHEQIRWLTNRLKVEVLSQEYTIQDYCQGTLEHECRYIDYPEKLPSIGEARNILLKRFYESDEDFTIVSDDDCILYEGKASYVDGGNIFEILRSINIDDMADIDVFTPVCPVFTPFTKFAEEHSDILKEKLYFERTTMLNGMYFIKNLKKHYGKEIYFDPKYGFDAAGNFVGGEDNFWTHELIANGLSTYRCRNIVLKEMASTLSSWSVKNENREGYRDVLNKRIFETFGVEREKFLKTYFKKPSRVTVDKIKREDTLEGFLNG